MSAIADGTLGGHIKAGTAKVEVAEALARVLFDGKRELKVGEAVVITPDFGKMTAHEQAILKGLFLKAEVRV